MNKPKSKNEYKEYRIISSRLTTDLYYKFQTYAELEGKNKAQKIAELVEAYLLDADCKLSACLNNEKESDIALEKSSPATDKQIAYYKSLCESLGEKAKTLNSKDEAWREIKRLKTQKEEDNEQVNFTW